MTATSAQTATKAENKDKHGFFDGPNNHQPVKESADLLHNRKHYDFAVDACKQLAPCLAIGCAMRIVAAMVSQYPKGLEVSFGTIAKLTRIDSGLLICIFGENSGLFDYSPELELVRVTKAAELLIYGRIIDDLFSKKGVKS